MIVIIRKVLNPTTQMFNRCHKKIKLLIVLTISFKFISYLYIVLSCLNEIKLDTEVFFVLTIVMNHRNF